MKVKKILISQPKPESEKSPYFDLIDKYNVKLDFRPFIKVEPIAAKDFRTQKVSILDHTAIVFNARHGIDHFFRLCEEMRITVPDNMKYFCVSESVALYLQKYIQFRKRKIFYGATGRMADLVPSMVKHSGEKDLVLTSDVHHDEMMKLFQANNLNVTTGIMYRTVSNNFTADETFDYDLLVFFSPAGVASLMKSFPEFEQGEIVIGCLGAKTAQAIRDAKLRLDIEVPTPQYTSMTMALDAFLKENHKKARK